MQFGICNEHFTERSLPETFELISDIGYDGVEVTPWTFPNGRPDLGADVVDDVRRAAETVGLDIIGVPRIFSAGEEFHIGALDESVRRRTVDHLEGVIQLCDRLGGDIVVFGSPDQRSVPADSTPGKNWDRAIETFSEPSILSSLEATDITLCMEPLGRPITDFVQSAEEALEFVREVDHPNVGVALDGYHLAREDDPAPDIIRDTGSYLAHFHGDNSEGRGPAYGSVDYDAVAGALDDVRYDGYVSLEIHQDLFETFEGDSEETATDALEYYRTMFR